MKITRSLLPLDAVQGFSSLLKAYMAGDEGLSHLYGFPPTDEGFTQLLAQNPFENTDRVLLAEAIRSQYAAGKTLPPSSVSANIKLLEEKNTYTICSGHQLCLFTGPLYFIYKLISAVNLAEALKKKHPALNFVPVYWLASEDHDFEEVNHVNLFGKKLSWTKETALGETAAMPAGKIATASLKLVLDELRAVLGTTANAQELYSLIEQAYLGHSNLADATRNLVNSLLGEYGLVILDANDARLKTRFSKVMEEELLLSPNFERVQQGIKDLAALGFEAQVNPREINLFYMRDDLRGRIEKTPGADEYTVVNTRLRFTKESALKELSAHPERFSPNVVLRPLYQQVILPNIAYVGGPGELAYWLEYKAMFDAQGVSFPVLVPRNFVLWVDANAAVKMDKLQQNAGNLSRSMVDLEKEFMQANHASEIKLDTEAERIQAVYTSIVAKASAVDVTLKAAAEGELQKTLNGLKSMEAKMMKAEKQKHETTLNQIKALKEKLYPGGVLQERVENFMPLYLKHGRSFLDTLKAGLDPFNHQLVVFREEME